MSSSADSRIDRRNKCCLARSALLRPAIADISIAEAAEHNTGAWGVVNILMCKLQSPVRGRTQRDSWQ